VSVAYVAEIRKRSTAVPLTIVYHHVQPLQSQQELSPRSKLEIINIQQQFSEYGARYVQNILPELQLTLFYYITLIFWFTGQFELAQPPNDAVSSLAFAPETSTRLLVSSWDKHVYLYDTQDGDEKERGTLVKKFEHRAPVLDICYGASDNEAFSACVDWEVHRYNGLRKGWKAIKLG
jgi:hypothetical protein